MCSPASSALEHRCATQPRQDMTAPAAAALLGLSFQHTLVAQGIEHRFPKPLGPSAVRWRQTAANSAFIRTVSCELCAVTQLPLRPEPTSNHHPESRMFVCLSRSLWVGWTGLVRATPLGGQARIRSHRPKSVGRRESADHYQDSIQGCVSRLLGQVPTQFSCGFNYPSLLDEGQGAIHACATVQ
jgi:hypothetical protein